jgi:serine/threonine protein phosphatase 1
MEVETAAGIVGLVHADCPFDDWREMQAIPWAEVDLMGRLASCCLWSIDRYEQRYAGQVRNVRAVVHGHMVVRSPEILGNVHFIDTGGWKPGGRFTFLELGALRTVSGPMLPKETVNRRNR